MAGLPVRIQDVFGQLARQSAEEPSRRLFGTIRQDGERCGMVDELLVPLHPETAAPSASAVGVFDQAIADKTDGVVVLRLLDRGVLGVLLVALHSVGPVFAKSTA